MNIRPEASVAPSAKGEDFSIFCCDFCCYQKNQEEESRRNQEKRRKKWCDTTKGIEEEMKWTRRQRDQIELFTCGPYAPPRPPRPAPPPAHKRGGGCDEVLIACGHKWILQTL